MTDENTSFYFFIHLSMKLRAADFPCSRDGHMHGFRVTNKREEHLGKVGGGSYIELHT